MDVDPGKFSDGALDLLLEGLRAAPEEIPARETLLKIFAVERGRRASQTRGGLLTYPEVTELRLSDLEPAIAFSMLTDLPLWMMLVHREFAMRQMAHELADPQDLTAISNFLTDLAMELRQAARRRPERIFSFRKKLRTH